VEASVAVVNRGDKEVRLPLDLLSEADQEFAIAHGGSVPTPLAGISLAGKPLEKGEKMNVIEMTFAE
jgi:hypothetical protein